MRNKITNIGELISCNIVRRLNRFTVLINIEGREEAAWLTNTGRLKEIIYEGNTAVCIKLSSPKKLKFVLVGTKVDENKFTLIDTRLQMKCFEIAQEKKMIDWLQDYKLKKRNIKLGKSLIDYYFTDNSKEFFIEVKSAVLFDGYHAMYPDCPSIRGRRHVEDLIEVKKKGKNAGLVFIAAHPFARAFKPFDAGDPILAQLIRKAYKEGVEIHALKMSLLKNGEIILEDPELEIIL
ncbi:MAG TPA: DNA/RNA nuclease SfsA [Geobacterales bacterium]|nr:DNA/RNA nuclease SfsA [Geobacterales bacterium]